MKLCFKDSKGQSVVGESMLRAGTVEAISPIGIIRLQPALDADFFTAAPNVEPARGVKSLMLFIIATCCDAMVADYFGERCESCQARLQPNMFELVRPDFNDAYHWVDAGKFTERIGERLAHCDPFMGLIWARELFDFIRETYPLRGQLQ